MMYAIGIRHRALLGAWALGLALFACDDEGGSAGFDVVIQVEPVAGNAPLRVRFSTDDNAPIEAELTYQWRFGDGATSEDAEPEHVYTSPGTYEVSVEVIGPGARGDATETIEVSAPADLVVDQVGFEPQRVEAGGDVEVSWGLRNAGADLVGRYDVVVYISPDGAFDAGAIELERLPRANDVASEALAGLTAEVSIPAELSSGDWIVGVIADPEAQVGDADRDNNRAVGPFPLQVSNTADTGPDLTICGVNIPSFDAVPAGQTPIAQLGDQLPVSVCLANLGDQPTPRASFTLFLSDDDAYDPDDVQVGRRAEIAIGVEDRESFELLVDLPLDLEPGEYRLIAVADPEGAVEEQRIDNNQGQWPGTFELAAAGQVEGIDLVAARLEVDGEQAFWGQALPGTLLLQNRGDTDAERPSIPIRVIAEPVDGGAPVQLQSVNHLGGVPAGGEIEVDLPVRVTRTVERGRYRISVEVDPSNSVDDVNPGNNRRTLQRELELGGEPNVDMAVSAVTLSAETIEAGAELTVSATVANLGIDPSGAVDAAVVFSADATFDVGDVVVDAFEIESLPGDERLEIERRFAVPVELDQQVPAWRVAIVLDPQDRLGEIDERNNVSFAPDPLVVEGATGGCAEDENEDNDAPGSAAPLAPGAYDALGACDDTDWFAVEVPAGSVLEVEATWAAADGAARLRLTDAEGETLLDAGQVRGRARLFTPATEADRTLLIEFDATARLQYALEVVVAPAAAGPDVRVRDVVVGPAVAEPGATLDVRFELVNLGQGAAAAGEVEVLLSDDDQLDDDDVVLGAVDAPRVDGGAAVAVQGEVDLPDDAARGSYTLIVRVREAFAGAPLRIDPDQACDADAFEPNGSPFQGGGLANAAPIEPGELADLNVCDGDDDWYAVEVDEGDRLEVSIEFDARAGDLDLALYAPDGERLVDESASLQNIETVTEPRAPEAGVYLVRVYLRGGAAAANQYTMRVTVQDVGVCADDDFEPNDRDNAVVLPDGEHDLFLCPGDEDWYRVPIAAGNIVSFRLAGGAAGVRIALFDPDGELIEEDNRSIVHTAEVNGTFLLRAAAPDAAERVLYALTVAGVSGVDLELTEARLSGRQVAPGGDLRADARVANLRGDRVNEVEVAFYLSADEAFDDDDERLGGAFLAVGGAEQVPASARLRVPGDTPAGAYFVVGVVDPGRDTPDIRRGNNVVALPLAVVAACADDDPRTNEGPRTATPLDAGEGAFEGGVICPHTEDWFALEADAGEVALRLEFEHAAGDLDLVVLDADFALLAESRTTADVEAVRFDLPAAGTIYVGVDGFLDAQNPYTLEWELP